MKKFLYVVVSDWDGRTDVLRVFKTLKDARNAFAKEKTFDIFDTNTGVTLDVTSIFVINEHLKTLADTNAKFLIEKR